LGQGDTTFSDNCKLLILGMSFKTGTHDWEKADSSFTPKKPIKSLDYHFLFRNRTGKAWFRNAVLTEVAPEPKKQRRRRCAETPGRAFDPAFYNFLTLPFFINSIFFCGHLRFIFVAMFYQSTQQ